MTSTTKTPKSYAVRQSGRLMSSALWLAGSLLVTGLVNSAGAQVVPNGDFDICDHCKSAVGNRVHLIGRAGFGTNGGTFDLVNSATSDQDVDNDGYTPGVNFNALVVSDTTDFLSLSDPSEVILKTNLVVADFLNPLNNGFSNSVRFYVNIPAGTPAGRYEGRFTIRDTLNPIGLNPNGEALRVDFLEVEIEVLPNRDFGLTQADSALEATSVTLRGRPGQTVSAVFRVANLGNIRLENVRFDITPLVATSGTGLRVNPQAITFSPTNITNVAIGDSTLRTILVMHALPPVQASVREMESLP